MPLNYEQVACLRHFYLMENLLNREGNYWAVCTEEQAIQNGTSLINVCKMVESLKRLFIHLFIYLFIYYYWKPFEKAQMLLSLFAGLHKECKLTAKKFFIISPSFTMTQKWQQVIQVHNLSNKNVAYF